nr:hypothetical protein [Micromonospora sp. DSM 115978]
MSIEVMLVVDTLVDAFPWVNFLPEDDRNEFVKEFVLTLELCGESDVWMPLGKMIHEWQQTAAIHVDPALARELSGPVDSDLGSVPVPMPPEEAGVEEE